MLYGSSQKVVTDLYGAGGGSIDHRGLDLLFS